MPGPAPLGWMASASSAPRRSRRRDPAADFEDAVARLVDLIKTSRHVVVCTGAGISTNAGIRDYRGPNGIWTEAQAMGVVSGEPGDKKSKVMETPWTRRCIVSFRRPRRQSRIA